MRLVVVLFLVFSLLKPMQCQALPDRRPLSSQWSTRVRR